MLGQRHLRAPRAMSTLESPKCAGMQRPCGPSRLPERVQEQYTGESGCGRLGVEEALRRGSAHLQDERALGHELCLRGSRRRHLIDGEDLHGIAQRWVWPKLRAGWAAIHTGCRALSGVPIAYSETTRKTKGRRHVAFAFALSQLQLRYLSSATVHATARALPPLKPTHGRQAHTNTPPGGTGSAPAAAAYGC